MAALADTLGAPRNFVVALAPDASPVDSWKPTTSHAPEKTLVTARAASTTNTAAPAPAPAPAPAASQPTNDLTSQVTALEQQFRAHTSEVDDLRRLVAQIAEQQDALTEALIGADLSATGKPSDTRTAIDELGRMAASLQHTVTWFMD